MKKFMLWMMLNSIIFAAYAFENDPAITPDMRQQLISFVQAKRGQILEGYRRDGELKLESFWGVRFRQYPVQNATLNIYQENAYIALRVRYDDDLSNNRGETYKICS